jgi:hypothetical protein
MFQLDVLRSQRSVLRSKLLSGRRFGHNDTFPSPPKDQLATPNQVQTSHNCPT